MVICRKHEYLATSTGSHTGKEILIFLISQEPTVLDVQQLRKCSAKDIFNEEEVQGDTKYLDV